MRIVWLPFREVFYYSPDDKPDLHREVVTFVGSTVSEVISNAPAVLGAYVEPEEFRGFRVLNVQKQRYLSLNGKILAQIGVKGKRLRLYSGVSNRNLDYLFDLLDNYFPDFDITVIRNTSV